MSWFNFGWTPEDNELLAQWRRERTDPKLLEKRTVFIDETKYDTDELGGYIPIVVGSMDRNTIFMPTLEKLTTGKELKGKKKRVAITPKLRNAVFQRDNVACVQCGDTRGLQIHHKDGNPSNNNLSNLETTCYECHKEYHKVTKRQ